MTDATALALVGLTVLALVAVWLAGHYLVSNALAEESGGDHGDGGGGPPA